MTDDSNEASDMGLNIITILLNYSCAFDYIHPEILLTKLRYYGFSNNTSHITDKKQIALLISKSNSSTNPEEKLCGFRFRKNDASICNRVASF